MKTILITFSVLALAAVSTMAQSPAAPAADKAPPPPPPRSNFTQPTTQQQGRDPFWPESTRVFDSNIAVSHASAAEPTTLKVDGYSIVGGRPIIIINHVSFLIGDEADLPAPGGGHTHVHCIDIQSDHVVVEINGMRREIRF